MKTVQGKRRLLQIIEALHPPRGFPCRLHGGQEQTDQHADDRNNDEKFDQCEAETMGLWSCHNWVPFKNWVEIAVKHGFDGMCGTLSLG